MVITQNCHMIMSAQGTPQGVSYVTNLEREVTGVTQGKSFPFQEMCVNIGALDP